MPWNLVCNPGISWSFYKTTIIWQLSILEIEHPPYYIAVWMHKTAGEEARWQLHKNVASNIEQVLAATPNKAPTIRPPASHHKNYPN